MRTTAMTEPASTILTPVKRHKPWSSRLWARIVKVERVPEGLFIYFDDGICGLFPHAKLVRHLKSYEHHAWKKYWFDLQFFKSAKVHKGRLDLRWPHPDVPRGYLEMGPVDLHVFTQPHYHYTAIRKNFATYRPFQSKKIVVSIRSRETTRHKQPHVHIESPSGDVSIGLNPVQFLPKGRKPRNKEEKKLIDWVKANEQALLRAWNDMQGDNPPSTLKAYFTK